MAYTQALSERDMQIDLPSGIKAKHDDSKSYVSMLLENLHGQNKLVNFDAGCNKQLLALGFEQLEMDEFVLLKINNFYCEFDDAMF